MKKFGNVLLNIIVGICAAASVWFILSFIDVNINNGVANPVYQSWNFFQIFFR